MRRIVAAVATTVLITVTAAAPAAAAPEQDPVYEISCGTVGDPICPVIDQLTALLAPLQPVLGITQPLLGGLGEGLTVLTTLLESAPGIPAAQLAQAAGDVLDQLGLVTTPVLALLSSLGIPADALSSTLGQLEALARHGIETFTQQPGAAGSSTSEPEPAPAPAPAPVPAPTARATSSGGAAPAQLGAPATAASAPSTTSTPTGTRRLTFPGVPAGSSLELSPLGLPRFAPSAPAMSASEQAAAKAAVAEVAEVVMPAVRAAAVPGSGDDDRTSSIMFALGALLLAAGLVIDQTRKAREPLSES